MRSIPRARKGSGEEEKHFSLAAHAHYTPVHAGRGAVLMHVVNDRSVDGDGDGDGDGSGGDGAIKTIDLVRKAPFTE